ncbi:MAG: purine-nucleoside phosphorylase [Lachnospiraceae bacterium]
MTPQEKLEYCYESIKDRMPFVPKVAIVLGTGLGDFAEDIRIEGIVDYRSIGGFPVSTVDSHKGRYIFGYVGEVPVVIMQGRVHYYEGYSMTDVVLPVRLMRKIGAERLLLTNAAGGVNEQFSAGDFMLITDHISNFVPSPLIGPNFEQYGLRFPDMSEVYDRELSELIRQSAKECDIKLQEGTYIQLSGPNFETPKEVKMCRILGADAVGMSTACEAMAAKHMGMRVCGISCISNMGCGMTDQPLTHTEVGETAARVAPLFRQLLTVSIQKIGKIGE